MGIFSRLFPGAGFGVVELARRLNVDAKELQRLTPDYREFFIAKRSGRRRRILAPNDELKQIHQAILRRLLDRLKAHPAAMGFERGRSIVTNALAHRRQDVVMRLDVVDFFASTKTQRVWRYFRRIGWNRAAADLLTRLCTYQGGLPQGAPTSPRLSNLVNYRLDVRLAAMAARLGAVYTRYADDITISLRERDRREHLQSGSLHRKLDPPFGADYDPDRIHYLRRFVRQVFEEAGYTLHQHRKASVRRRHHRQIVCGLVVNDRVNLPRETRRWLRAVEHRTRMQEAMRRAPYQLYEQPCRPPTLSRSQLEGWRALQLMIARQSASQE